MPIEYRLKRAITHKNCPWLDPTDNFAKDEIVYSYDGVTYGCISDSGEAFTREPGETPFFELPRNAVERIIDARKFTRQ
jgi:hypothetical protein